MPAAAPVVRFATAADVPALVSLKQQTFPDPWPEDSLAQEVEGPGTLVLITAESYVAPPLGLRGLTAPWAARRNTCAWRWRRRRAAGASPLLDAKSPPLP